MGFDRAVPERPGLRLVTCLAPFHPAVQAWFASRFGQPTPAQREGWPLIREGRHVLIAAPTGSGKTLAPAVLRPRPAWRSLL